MGLFNLLTRSVIKKIKYYNNYSTVHESALYITGFKAKTVYAVLTPYIDFDERLENENLEENIKARDLEIDLNKVKRRWATFHMIKHQKIVLEVTRDEISKMMNQLLKEPEKFSDDIRKLKDQAKIVKNDHSNVKGYLYDLEEMAAKYILNLPNVLHKETPLDCFKTIHAFLEPSKEKSKSHMEIALNHNLIDYINPMFYYLKGDAALFELGLTNYCKELLLDSNYKQFSNADFTKSVVIEGCGTDFYNSEKVFTLKDPYDEKSLEICSLHLTGGATLYAFMAYFAKHLILENQFPLQFFSIGKKYSPTPKNVEHNLFNLNQETVVDLFCATEDDNAKQNKEFNNIVKVVTKFYESLGIPFKLVYWPANKLEKSESLRLSIELFSNYNQSFVEVGNVSVYDNFLSKRLLFAYNNKKKERTFPKVIAGTLLNVPKFLGCVLENNSINNKPLLSDLIKKYVPVEK